MIAVVCIIFIFLLWFFYGGQRHEPQGLLTIVNTLKKDPIDEAKIGGIINSNSPVIRPQSNPTPDDEPVEIQTPKLPPTIKSVPANTNVHKHGSGIEKRACEAAAKVFGVSFEASYKPEWMRNPSTDRILELDCYNDEIKVAIEYNGIHHYQYPNWTTKKYNISKAEFAKQVQRDLLKPELCDQQGVWLITIPYTVKEADFEEYIEYYSPYRVAEREGYDMPAENDRSKSDNKVKEPI